jgi:hypothetical protein
MYIVLPTSAEIFFYLVNIKNIHSFLLAGLDRHIVYYYTCFSIHVTPKLNNITTLLKLQQCMMTGIIYSSVITGK